MNDDWQYVPTDAMTLREYPCGVTVGEMIALREDLVYRNGDDQPTGEVRRAGSEAVVLIGNPDEPDVVWIRWHDGECQTWDETILDDFKLT
jgi:hypothetical protein